MSFRKHTIWALAMGVCLGGSALTRDAAACGGEWYPEVSIDHRIHGVAQAEKSLANGNRLAAAASVIRMMPHIKTLKSKPGSLVGRATAGSYGHVLGKSLALAYVDPGHADVGAAMEIEILGEKRQATVLGESPFDPENRRLRAC